MRFKARMAALKASLSQQLEGRTTLAENGRQTHEMSFTRYGPGAFLPRHTDEHHDELKKAHPVASGDENVKRLAALAASTSAGGTSASDASVVKDPLVGEVIAATGRRPPKTRRSVTW